MVAVYNVLGCAAFLAGFDGDWHSMFVAAADEHNLLALCAQIAHIDVGWDIDAGQVSDVDGTVGVGQGRGFGVAFEFVVFLCVGHIIVLLR